MSTDADAWKIVRWWQRYSTTVEDVSAALTQVLDWADATTWDDERAAQLTSSAQNLHHVVERTLRTPRSGVASFDTPRRTGLVCYMDASELLINADLRADYVDEAALMGFSELLDLGREHVGRSTAIAQGFVDMLNSMPPPRAGRGQYGH